MKQLLIILVLLTATPVLSAQYISLDKQNTNLPEASCLDEVQYDRNGIPMNCSAFKYRQFKRQKDREYRRYHGTRTVDRIGGTAKGLGTGLVKFGAYIASATIVTIAVMWIMDKAN